MAPHREKNMLKIAAICLSLFSFAATYQTGTEASQKAIRKVVDRFVEAWNAHDAHAFAGVFAADADFTNVRGAGATGRAKIEEFHAPLFATIFKSSHQSYTDIKIRFIRADVAAVDVRWQLISVLDEQGNPRPDRNGLLSFVMTENAGAWQITVMHNLELTAPPSK
jgi:uncharacterized protein (TIGR02246 family)